MMRLFFRAMGCALAIAAMWGLAAAEAQSDAAATSRGSRSRDLLRQASASVDEGDYEAALATLDQLKAADPAHPDVYYQTARVYLSQGDTVAAMQSLEEGVEQGRRSPRTKLLLARLRIHTGAFESASEVLDQVLLIKPGDGEALYLKGLVFLAAGDTVAALDRWEEAIAARMRNRHR